MSDGETGCPWGNGVCVGRRGVCEETGCPWRDGASVGTLGVRGDTGRPWGHGACVGTRDVRGDTGRVWGHGTCAGTRGVRFGVKRHKLYNSRVFSKTKLWWSRASGKRPDSRHRDSPPVSYRTYTPRPDPTLVITPLLLPRGAPGVQGVGVQGRTGEVWPHGPRVSPQPKPRFGRLRSLNGPGEVGTLRTCLFNESLREGPGDLRRPKGVENSLTPTVDTVTNGGRRLYPSQTRRTYVSHRPRSSQVLTVMGSPAEGRDLRKRRQPIYVPPLRTPTTPTTTSFGETPTSGTWWSFGHPKGPFDRTVSRSGPRAYRFDWPSGTDPKGFTPPTLTSPLRTYSIPVRGRSVWGNWCTVRA